MGCANGLLRPTVATVGSQSTRRIWAASQSAGRICELCGVIHRKAPIILYYLFYILNFIFPSKPPPPPGEFALHVRTSRSHFTFALYVRTSHSLFKLDLPAAMLLSMSLGQMLSIQFSQTAFCYIYTYVRLLQLSSAS
jgi:hypothetical protein